VDTPPQRFGGEVERALKMVDGVMLLLTRAKARCPRRVRAEQGPGKPTASDLVINKIDRSDARPQEVLTRSTLFN